MRCKRRCPQAREPTGWLWRATATETLPYLALLPHRHGAVHFTASTFTARLVIRSLCLSFDTRCNRTHSLLRWVHDQLGPHLCPAPSSQHSIAIITPELPPVHLYHQSQSWSHLVRQRYASCPQPRIDPRKRQRTTVNTRISVRIYMQYPPRPTGLDLGPNPARLHQLVRPCPPHRSNRLDRKLHAHSVLHRLSSESDRHYSPRKSDLHTH